MMNELAQALNDASRDFEVGRLQEMRVQLRSLDRAPSRAIFGPQTIHETYAFHVGGRTELQFNVGMETLAAGTQIRHGVAFSLELSQTLPTLDPLLPKIARFNDYVRNRAEDLPGFRMWHHGPTGRSEDRPVGPIPDELIVPNTFIVLGRHVPADQVQVPAILADFDQLLPLYVFVESTEHTLTLSREREPFRSGWPSFSEHSTASLSARTIDVALRHGAIQNALYDLLRQEAGEDNVRMEYPLAFGVRVDAAVRRDSGFAFYEVKVAPTVQSCVRAALGQLLEYAHWPSDDRAQELIVVGEAEIDDEGRAYLRFLRHRFALPVWYRRVNLERRVLGPRT